MATVFLGDGRLANCMIMRAFMAGNARFVTASR